MTIKHKTSSSNITRDDNNSSNNTRDTSIESNNTRDDIKFIRILSYKESNVLLSKGIAYICNTKDTSSIVKNMCEIRIPSHLKRVRKISGDVNLVLLRVIDGVDRVIDTSSYSIDEGIACRLGDSIDEGIACRLGTSILVDVPVSYPYTLDQLRISKYYWSINNYKIREYKIDYNFIFNSYLRIFRVFLDNSIGLDMELEGGVGNSIGLGGDIFWMVYNLLGTGDMGCSYISYIPGCGGAIPLVDGESCLKIDHAVINSINLNNKNSLDYLCTGGSIFMLYECCMSCFMSLVHGRVRNVFFIRERKDGIFSSKKIHTVEELNHRINVYKLDWMDMQAI